MTKFNSMIEKLLMDSLTGMEPAWQLPSFSYPKVNLVKVDNGYRFEFAVAGFNKSELSVEAGPGYVQVSGTPAQATDELKNYVWKNISSRPFNVRLGVNDAAKLGKIKLDNGILSLEIGEDTVTKPTKLNIE